MQYVYVLSSTLDGSIYTGCTNDLRKRLALHNAGKVKSTRLHRPFEIVFYEAYRDAHDAFVREQYLKTGWGRNHIKKVAQNYFIGKNLGG